MLKSLAVLLCGWGQNIILVIGIFLALDLLIKAIDILFYYGLTTAILEDYEYTCSQRKERDYSGDYYFSSNTHVKAYKWEKTESFKAKYIYEIDDFEYYINDNPEVKNAIGAKKVPPKNAEVYYSRKKPYKSFVKYHVSDSAWATIQIIAWFIGLNFFTKKFALTMPLYVLAGIVVVCLFALILKVKYQKANPYGM